MTGEPLWKSDARNLFRSALTGEPSRLDPLQAYYFAEGWEFAQKRIRCTTAGYQRNGARAMSDDCAERLETALDHIRPKFKSWEQMRRAISHRRRQRRLAGLPDLSVSQFQRFRKGRASPSNDSYQDIAECIHHCEQNPDWPRQFDEQEANDKEVIESLGKAPKAKRIRDLSDAVWNLAEEELSDTYKTSFGT
jgi:hypothetical protein